MAIVPLFFHSPALAENLAFLVIDGDSFLAHQAVTGLDLPEPATIRVFSSQDLTDPKAKAFVESSQVIIVDVMVRELVRFVLDNQLTENRQVYALRSSGDDEELRKKGFLFHAEVREYFDHLSDQNLKNLIRRVVNLSIDKNVTYEPVVHQPTLGIYHPQASELFLSYGDYRRWYERRPQYQPQAPWLGLMFFSTSIIKGQVDAVNHIISTLEKSGFNVLPCFGKDEGILTKLFLNDNRQARIDLIVSFSLKFYSAINERMQRALETLDVPVINAINLYSREIDQWRADPIGIPPLDVAWSVATPEISGACEPTPLSGKMASTAANIPGRFFVYRPIEETLNNLVPRLKRWLDLQRQPNKEKKVAIFYYNHAQGKQNVGASYLNVCRSLENILDRLKREGYRVPAQPRLSESGIKDMILRTGLNIGAWAPGELKRLLASGSLVKVPMTEYIKWFRQLPHPFQEAVNKQWGPPESADIMVKDGHFIIPAVTLGNLVLLPEPARGWSDSPIKLYHDVTVYPHHQYIAAYLWLKYGFKADAMIHLGTHATHEWLPGKQVGLSPSCPPEVLITDIPNLYPYIVDDVGEGLQAKRRGRAVLIDHLTPPVKSSGLYNEYDNLKNLLEGYKKGRALGAQTAQEYLEQIRTLARRLGLDKDLKLTEINEAAVEQLAVYLHEIDDELLPYGLHTFGRSPDGAALEDTLKAITDKNAAASPQAVRQGLAASGKREIDHLIKGLSGKYIPAGEGNDPIRNPGALPTGKNFYGFSPNKLPSAAAWKLGQKAADEIIRKHLADHQRYPEKVAIVLWAVETLRNEGLNECTALSLMGIEPVWNKNGRVSGSRVIPGAELQRPRLDVVLNPSGLYRDLFPDKLLFLDQAVQQAAAQTDIENYLRKHNQLLKEKLRQTGHSEEQAETLSRLRIFSEAPGSYGNRVAELTSASGFWKTDGEIADVYQKHTGFAYGAGQWGISARKLFSDNLKDVATVVHSISSNIYGTMDNDDMFAFLGGLSLAVRRESGKNPDTLVSLQRQSANVHLEDAGKTIGREMRTRYFNPKWISGMKAENYAGAREMSKFVEYLWGWQVTLPTAVDQTHWEQVFEIYVEDKYRQELKEFFDRVNPWAYQSITARILETVRKGYWSADETITRKLAVEYALNVVAKGVACCDHTCNNPLLNQMVVNIISLPGVLTPKIVEQFRVAIEKAAGRSLDDQIRHLNEVQESLAAGFTKKAAASPPNEQTQKNRQPENQSGQTGPAKQAVEGFKMEKIDQTDDRTDLSSSGVKWFASLFILLLIGLFVFGTCLNCHSRIPDTRRSEDN